MNAPQSPNPNPNLSSNPSNANPRKKALSALAGLVVLVGLSWTAYEFFVASHYESTDNAYVQGNVIQITPQIGGTVAAIMADDTDFVKAGQSLVQLDPADAKVALDQAEAALAQAVRQVRTLYANNASLSAQVALREAEVPKAQSDITRASDDLNRRQPLVSNGAVSQEAGELVANPLRVGLSMNVQVDVREQGGKMLADAPRTAALAHTQAFAVPDGAAEADVQRVIAANLAVAAVAAH